MPKTSPPINRTLKQVRETVGDAIVNELMFLPDGARCKIVYADETGQVDLTLWIERESLDKYIYVAER